MISFCLKVLEPSDTGLTFEGLIDALLVLYEECGHDKVKSKSEVVAAFLAKFQAVVHNYDRLRVNIGDFQVRLKFRNNVTEGWLFRVGWTLGFVLRFCLIVTTYGFVLRVGLESWS